MGPEAELGGWNLKEEAGGAAIKDGRAALVADLEGGGFFKHGFAARIEELDGNGGAGQREILREADLDEDLERGGVRGEVDMCGGLDVGDVDERGGVERDVAVEAAEAPLVLVLDEGGVGVLDDEGDEFVVDARADEAGEVELGGEAGIFGETDGHAIDVDGEHGVGAAEVEDGALALPGGGDAEKAAVDAGGIFGGGEGRLLGEGHLHVGVVGAAVAVHLPVGRDGQGAPGGGVGERAAIGEGLGVGGVAFEAELPEAVEGLEPGGFGAVAGEGLAGGREGVEGGARGELVEGRELGVFPGVDETVEEHDGKLGACRRAGVRASPGSGERVGGGEEGG